MARLAVNPTRMELRRLKERLKTAVRGHKLLKDKSDEMIRQFMNFVRENKQLREEIEQELAEALHAFMLAKAVTDKQDVVEALSLPGIEAEVETGEKNVMGIDVPSLSIRFKEGGDFLPYSFAATSADMDTAILKISELMKRLLQLAEIEKTCNMLADEIERNRRRVNALEYVMIPQLTETIKYILMKLDENERATTIRLMKVKSIIEKQEAEIAEKK